MTTKLLRQIQEQDQEALAAEYNGETKRQPRRIWAVEALKPELTEEENAAAVRAVKECGLVYAGRIMDEGVGAGFQIYRHMITGLLTSSKEVMELKRSDAQFALNGLRQGVSKRCDMKPAANCADWLVQLWTLQDIAVGVGCWRNMGAKRDPIPDVRAVKPMVRLVLLAMAGYYDDCDAGRDRWRGVA